MTARTVDANFFVAGGTLKANTPSYVKRPADDELFEAVMAGQLCYVLTPRQMGKSSIMTRNARRLEEQGIRTARIDLTGIGTKVTAQQWYTSIISQLNRKLNLGVDTQKWCKQREGLAQVQVFAAFIEEIILEKIAGRVVIFIDEIDSTLNLDFRDDFFAGLRAIYNARTEKPALERISFVLLGVASPSDLISDRARTPFNIGHAISLQEFDFEHARVLQDGLDAIYSSQGEQILKRIFYWTNGHPYLTQKLCSEIVERKRDAWLDTDIDQLVNELFLSEQARKETNLKFVQDRLLDSSKHTALLGLYKKILQGGVSEDGQSALQNELKLSGLIRAEKGKLTVRNLIYRTVFNLHWVQGNTPQNWYRVAAIIFGTLFISMFSLLAYDFVVGNLSRQYAGDVFTSRTASAKLQNLSRIFELKGVFTPDYDFRARELFYNMKWDEQIGLFTDSSITPDDKKAYLVPVVQGLYMTMANVSDGQDSTELLSAMRAALIDVASPESQELQKEIYWWLQARSAENNQEAIDNYNKAIALESDNPSTRYERARVELQTGQYQLALSDLNAVMALAQNISTEAYEKEIPTLTPRSKGKRTPVSTISSTPNSTTDVPIDVTQTPRAPGSATPTILTDVPNPLTQSPQTDTTPSSGYTSYRSNFFSIAYIRSAVNLLLDDGLLLPDFVFFANQTDKYPNLVSAGLLSQIITTPELIDVATVTNTPILVSSVTQVNNSSTSTAIGDMILIPSGSFLMGAKENDPFEPWYGEFPEHEVYLKSYMIAKTEVTNAMYRQCVYESHCIPPMDLSSATKKDYYENTAYNTFPIIHVTWEQAKRFCEWRGQRLPTEAEWEKAARGEKANLFPWGDIPPSCALANFQGCPSNDTVSVGSFPVGASPYGVLDMAGNVSEWVMDWMGETYYQNSPQDNPTGPESGSDHIIRGGGWDDPIREQRSTARGGLTPTYIINQLVSVAQWT